MVPSPESAALAHIVVPGGLPAVAAWVIAAILVGGLLGALYTHGRLRLLAISVAAAAAVVSVLAAVGVLLPGAPSSQGLSIALLTQPGAPDVTAPVSLRVCGWDAGGAAVAMPGGGRLVAVSVDGRLQAESTQPDVSLILATGAHDLSAEILTSDHRELSPPLVTTLHVRVSGPGPISGAAACHR